MTIFFLSIAWLLPKASEASSVCERFYKLDVSKNWTNSFGLVLTSSWREIIIENDLKSGDWISFEASGSTGETQFIMGKIDFFKDPIMGPIIFLKGPMSPDDQQIKRPRKLKKLSDGFVALETHFNRAIRHERQRGIDNGMPSIVIAIIKYLDENGKIQLTMGELESFRAIDGLKLNRITNLTTELFVKETININDDEAKISLIVSTKNILEILKLESIDADAKTSYHLEYINSLRKLF